jgi:hypothetical protein
MDDQNGKKMCNFYCRDYLWDVYEAMAKDMFCSVDYLINEAMRHYARSKNYPLPTQSSDSMAAPRQNSAPMQVPSRVQQPMASSQYNQRSVAPQQPPMVPQQVSMRPQQPPQPPMRPMAAQSARQPTMLADDMDGQQLMGRSAMNQPAARPMAPPPSPVMPSRPVMAPSRPTIPPVVAKAPSPYDPTPYEPAPPVQQRPMATPSRPQPPAARSTLSLIFQGQRYLVDKEEFVIGRGSKTSDLAIKDGNVSRKHASVVLHNGSYYIKDCGSTNGIDYNGMRIETKKIEEGDVFFICDYELRFTYR